MKIILVCESFSSQLSGGRVSRYLQKILVDKGHEVQVIVTGNIKDSNKEFNPNENFVTYLGESNLVSRMCVRLSMLLNPYQVPLKFKKLFQHFNPQIVHFASFDHTKSANLYRYCHKKKVSLVLQPWTMHFYCAQGFGFKSGKQCIDCITDGFSKAIIDGCIGLKGVVGQLEKIILRRMVIKNADAFLSSNEDLDNLLKLYGVSENKIYRFPVIFDYSNLSKFEGEQGNYYIYYGQTNAHKGVNAIIDIFRRMPNRKLILCPMEAYIPNSPLPVNIKIISGMGWSSGLHDAIKNSKAVIVPSLWATSTEYTLCEAMAIGKPVIVFGVGVHKDILTHKKNALIIEVANFEMFNSALDDLEGGANLYNNLSTFGRRLIVEINEPNNIYTKLINIYSKVLR